MRNTVGWIVFVASIVAVPASETNLDRARSVETECARLSVQGRAALQADRFADAAEAFAALVACRDTSPFLVVGSGDVPPDGDCNDPACFEFMRRSETRLRDAAVGLLAYAEWRRQDDEACKTALNSSGPGDPSARRRELAAYVTDHAVELFERKDWPAAASAYAFARRQTLLAANGSWDDRVGRLAFNEAMARLNAGSIDGGRELLLEIRRVLPDHRPQELAEVLANLDRASVLGVFEELEQAAHGAFDAGDWPLAAERFEEAARYLLTRSVPESDSSICSLRHNVARALWNRGRLTEARQVLARLRQVNPAYEPARLAEDLRRLDALLAPSPR